MHGFRARAARTWPRWIVGALLALLLFSALSVLSETPRTDRDWFPYLSRTAEVERDGAEVRVSPVSDWRYVPEGPAAEVWTEAAFDPDALRRLWFVLEPQPGSTIAAHTFLLFEFAGDRFLGLTIEARRERDEPYSAVRGVFRAFELAYHWGTARDLLTRRARWLDHEVYVYPVRIDAVPLRALLDRLLDETATLARSPRFYNTLFSNCTNELAKAAGLSWTPEFILTGGADEFLFEEGFIPAPDFETARARADLTAWLLEAGDTDFDARLLSELRSRHAL
ncbi:MAG: DUF4105 domain-containing protein [Pseudomonadales bacterium]|jgi:hypothetical protein|nr:DUF4105 domain-containing protein [Pseudomonadales bacterium]